MIILYSGTPGSCKSMHQAEVIYHMLRDGDVVLANYHINIDKIPKLTGQFYQYDIFDLNPDMLKSFSVKYFQSHKFKEGTLNLFIDEAQLIFNAREWGRGDRKSWLEFFTQHRKYGYDIFMIAQSDMMLDKQIRSLIEHEFIHRKFSSGGGWNKIFNVVMGGGTYVCIKVWYPLKMQLGKSFHHIRKKYYSLYDSYRDFSLPDCSADFSACIKRIESDKAASGSIVSNAQREGAQPVGAHSSASVSASVSALPNRLQHSDYTGGTTTPPKES